ncbi:hypothetical protein TNCV_4487401 [Trichonephila clavipes]|nr:hypothetical protein TNCV_4487401 [Trichonephila clavipes]
MKGMSLRRHRRQYEQMSEFESGRIIGMMEVGWSARRVARQAYQAHQQTKRCLLQSYYDYSHGHHNNRHRNAHVKQAWVGILRGPKGQFFSESLAFDRFVSYNAGSWFSCLEVITIGDGQLCPTGVVAQTSIDNVLYRTKDVWELSVSPVLLILFAVIGGIVLVAFSIILYLKFQGRRNIAKGNVQSEEKK